MSVIRANRWQDTSGQLNSTVLQTRYVSSTTRTNIDTTTLVEVSTAYRVTITPRFANSLIVLNYFIPMNPGASYATNTIYTIRAWRSTNGGATRTYSLTSAGAQLSNRIGMAGVTFRPPGYDLNDPMTQNFFVLDTPGTVSLCTYGFEFRRESGGTGNVYFGYSAGDSTVWGFNTNITITAQEIAQ